jgi:hypothetical protein
MGTGDEGADARDAPRSGLGTRSFDGCDVDVPLAETSLSGSGAATPGAERAGAAPCRGTSLSLSRSSAGGGGAVSSASAAPWLGVGGGSGSGESAGSGRPRLSAPCSGAAGTPIPIAVGTGEAVNAELGVARSRAGAGIVMASSCGGSRGGEAPEEVTATSRPPSDSRASSSVRSATGLGDSPGSARSAVGAGSAGSTSDAPATCARSSWGSFESVASCPGPAPRLLATGCGCSLRAASIWFSAGTTAGDSEGVVSWLAMVATAPVQPRITQDGSANKP